MLLEAKKTKIVDRLQQRIHDLPLLPEVVLALLRLDPGDDNYFEDVVRLVRSDPTLAARLLRYANSPAISPTSKVAKIDQALQLVGCEAAVGIAVADSIMRTLMPRHDWELDLWRHAFDVACLMQELAPLVESGHIDPERAYLFGLLHDIGRFILYLEAPVDLRAIGETSWESQQALIDAELEICGISHAELGYLAIRKWGLEDEMAIAARFHHSSKSAAGDVDAEQLAMVRLLQDADWIGVMLALRVDLWRSASVDGLRALLRPPQVQSRYDVGRDDVIDLIKVALTRSEHMQTVLGIAPAAAAAVR